MRRSLVLLTTLLMAGSSLSLHAQSALATTTTLAVGPSSSVAFEQPVTLTATITDSNSAAVLLGTVTFYDGTTALGTSSIIRNGSAGFTPGTAIFRTRSLAQTTHSLTATFNSTKADQKSTSGVQSVTITAAAGPYPSATLLSSTSPSSGEYDLTATMGGFGPFAPTGSVTFNDLNSSRSLGTATLGTGTPGFLTSSLTLANIPDSGVTYCSAAVVAGDFNNDGNLDLVSVVSGPGPIPLCASGDGNGDATLETWLGNGDGTFTPLPVESEAIWNVLNAGFQTILVADFNGDGNLDLLIPRAGDGNGYAELLLGNGDGTFQAPVALNTAGLQSGLWIVTADFNGDGIPDLAVPDNGGPNVGVYLGNGDGTFTFDTTVSTGFSELDALATADINNDGHVDLVAGGRNAADNGMLTVAPGNGDGTFQSPIEYTPPANFPGGQPGGTAGLSVANLAGGGPPQILWFTGVSGSPRSELVVVSWAGISSTATAYPVSANTGNAPPIPGDFTISGHQSVAVYDAYSGEIFVYPGNGDGTLQTPYSVQPAGQSTPFSPMAAGDFRNDGNTDLAIINVNSYFSPDTSGGTVYTLEPAMVSSAGVTNVSVCSPQQVAANYSGDSNFSASVSPETTFSGGPSCSPFGFVGPVQDATTGGTAAVGQADGLTVGGVAADPTDGTPVHQVQILIDGAAVGNATLGISSPGLAAQYNNPAFAQGRWIFNYPASGLSLGKHTLSVVASDTLGLSATIGTESFSVAAASSGPFGSVDPVQDATTGGTAAVAQGDSLTVSGVAADPHDGTPVHQVQILIDGTAVGNATLGLLSVGLDDAYNNSAYSQGRWVFTYPASGLALGSHMLRAVATDSLGLSATIGSETFTVALSSSGPFGLVQEVQDATTGGTAAVAQSDSLTVGGVAADPHDGTPVHQVQILIDGAAVGNATLGIASPGLAASYNNSAYANGRWIFTSPALGLSLGSHTLRVVATDSLGLSATIGTESFTVATVSSGPFGSVEEVRDATTGTASEVAQSHSLSAGGLAADPHDGTPVHQVQILIDGAPAGNATLGIASPGLATDYSNPAYAHGRWIFTYPASGLSLGSHTLRAVATDSLGLSLTIGSNAFTVTN